MIKIQKKNLKIIFVLIFMLYTTTIFTATIPSYLIITNDHDENSIESVSAPHISAEGDITSLWNHTFPNDLKGVAISGDGKYISAINYSTAITFHRNSNSTLWKYDAGKIIQYYAMSMDGRYIVLSDSDENITVLDAYLETEVWNFDDSSPASNAYVDISADGNYIAVANNSGGVYLFNNAPSAGQKEPIWWYDDGTSRDYRDIAISANGKYILVGDNNGNITLFDTATTIPTYKWQFDTTSLVRNVEISGDGKYLIALNSENVYLFNTTNPGGKPMWNYTTNELLDVIDISADGKKIVVAGPYNLYYFNNSFQSGNKTAEWGYPIVDHLNINEIEIAGGYQDMYYIAFGTFSPTFYLLNSSKTTPKQPIYSVPITNVEHVSLSTYGDYFVFGSQGTDTIYLYHHDVPVPEDKKSEGEKDDEDSDDDDAPPAIPGFSLLILTLASAASIIIVTLKKKTNFN